MPSVHVDKKLFDFTQTSKRIAELRGVAASNPIVIRMTLPSSGTLNVMVCSYEEPSSQFILPLNVLWLNLNAASTSYMRLARRVGKGGGSNGLVDRWALVSNFADIDIQQEYDDADKQRLQDTVNVGPAGSNKLGLVRLSAAPTLASNPIAVGTNDPRLSDARTPLPHTHSLPPVTQIQTATGVINIDQSVTPESGMVLFALNASTATWKHLSHSDIIAG